MVPGARNQRELPFCFGSNTPPCQGRVVYSKVSRGWDGCSFLESLSVYFLIMLNLKGITFSSRVGSLWCMCSHKAVRHHGYPGNQGEWSWAVWKWSGFSMPSFTFAASGDYDHEKMIFSLFISLYLLQCIPFIYFILYSSYGYRIYFFSSVSSLAVKAKNYSPHYFQAFLSPSHSRKDMLCTEELSCYIPIYLCIVKIHQWFSYSFYFPESSAWILETVCFYI